MTQYAYFDISTYKYAVKTEARQRDLAALCPVYGPQTLRAHLLLVPGHNDVSYVATTVWSSQHWHRDPEAPSHNISRMDSLFMEKYERIVKSIVSGSSSVSTGPVVIQQQPTTGTVLPSPIPASLTCQQNNVVNTWSDQELIRNKIGRVTNIIDANYGIAVVRMRAPGSSNVRARAIVLFDTCDVWVGVQTAQQMDMALHTVMKEGDHVKMRAILVPESENRKNIRYLATSLVIGSSRTDVRTKKLPEQDPLDNIEQIHPSKINNFYTVVSAVCNNLPGDGEEECRGVSTDEDDLTDTSLPPPSLVPMVTPNTPAALSLDAYEQERQKRKLAKANECTLTRKKLGYDKAAREALLMELKLKNQLMWKCPECNVTCSCY